MNILKGFIYRANLSMFMVDMKPPKAHDWNYTFWVVIPVYTTAVDFKSIKM